MVSEQKAKDRKGGSAMDQRSDIQKGSRSQRDSRNPPKHAETEREHDMTVVASRLEEDLTCVSSTGPPTVWYIDSGASAHMTRVRECFSSYQEEQMNFQITMGNKAKCNPVGRGTIIFQTKAGNKIQTTNVLHVPGLGMNLLSVSQLQNKGYDV